MAPRAAQQPLVLITGGSRRAGAGRRALLPRGRAPRGPARPHAGERRRARAALGFDALTGQRRRDRPSPAVEAALGEVPRLGGVPQVLVNGAGIAQSSPLFPPDDALFGARSR